MENQELPLENQLPTVVGRYWMQIRGSAPEIVKVVEIFENGGIKVLRYFDDQRPDEWLLNYPRESIYWSGRIIPFAVEEMVALRDILRVTEALCEQWKLQCESKTKFIDVQRALIEKYEEKLKGA